MRTPPTIQTGLFEDVDFDAEHPGVYDGFAKEARRLAGLGRKHYSAKAIIERLRYFGSLSDAAGPWKLNNSHTAYLARRLARDDAATFGSFFEFRKSAADGGAVRPTKKEVAHG